MSWFQFPPAGHAVGSYPAGWDAWQPSPHDPTLLRLHPPGPSAPQIGPRIPSCSLENVKVMITTCARSKTNRKVNGDRLKQFMCKAHLFETHVFPPSHGVPNQGHFCPSAPPPQTFLQNRTCNLMTKDKQDMTDGTHDEEKTEPFWDSCLSTFS